MKFINYNNSGLFVDECQKPEINKHEILIKVAACGVNRADLYQAQGNYPAPNGVSDILGLEVSGIVIAIGDEVGTHAIGDKVCALLQGGGYAQYVVVGEHRALPVPKGLSMIEAAGVMEVFATAYYNLFDAGRLKPNQKVLIHGGSSGVGHAAIQLAKTLFGAEIFTTVGNQKKVEFCQDLGADHVTNYKDQDFVKYIKDATNGSGVDLVLDIVGGEYIERNMRSCAYKAMIISIAFIQGAKTNVNFAPFLMKNLTMKGTTLRNQDEVTIYELLQSLRDIVWVMFEDQDLKVEIDEVFNFSDAQLAHDKMQNFGNIGKLILDFNSSSQSS